MSPIPDGTYVVVNSVVRAFHAAGVSRANVSQFHEIAKSVEAGSSSAEEADKKIAALGDVFLSVWRGLNANGTAIQTIVAIIALFLMIYYEQRADDDPEKFQSIAERQIIATQSIERVERRIIDELHKNNVVVQTPHIPPKSVPAQQQVSQPQTTAPVSTQTRQQRRRADQLAKKRNREKP